MTAIDHYENTIRKLKADLSRIHLEREQFRAEKSVHMQTLALIAGAHPELLGDLIRKRVRFAREEALKVRLEDCVVAKPAGTGDKV